MVSNRGKEVVKDKGKAIAGSKRGRGGGAGDDNDKSGKRRNRNVLQFFEAEADVINDDDAFSDIDFDELFGEEFQIDPKIRKEPPKVQNIPVVPKEEEMDEEEFEKMMEERFRGGNRFATHAEDAYESKRSVDRNPLLPSSMDPILWKVKCMVGRERHSAFCLMQKFVDLKSLGTKLEIISAFAVDHIKGFIYIEAEKQGDINEACKGLSGIYSSRLAPVPRSDVSHLLTVRSKSNEVTAGTWARVKNGRYKGDLAQIVAVNNEKRRATIKVIPRIDLQALAQKYGGGVPLNKNITPSPKLISTNELEEFRPLIQYRRDRDTGDMLEVLDGLMFKDGYLYKKVSIDSLSCWGVVPSEDELLKFTPDDTNEDDNLEWLTQLYGVQKKKRVVGNEKGNEKGGSSSGSSSQKSFELYELVCHGRKSFGLVVGFEKEGYYKIMKEGPEGSIVETVDVNELKSGPADIKFTAQGQNKKTISVNDTVKVLEGPLKDRQGIVKQIYRGIIFVYDENDTDNGGYFCCKAQICEKVKLFSDALSGKDGGSGSPGFEDFPSSPKSPLSPKKPWQSSENNREFNRGDREGMFSIGQTLRIRIGPLKGFLCRVLAIRYSEVTVKLDSKHKVLTVKCEHLSEVRDRTSTRNDDPGSSSFKPFDLLGTEGWTGGVGTSTAGNESGVLVTEGSSWDAASSGLAQNIQDSSANPWNSTDTDIKKDAAWETKGTLDQGASWGASMADNKAVSNNEQTHGWGGSNSGASDGWNKGASTSEDPVGSSWNKQGNNEGERDMPKGSSGSGDAWGKALEAQDKGIVDTWGKAIESQDKGSTDIWGKAIEAQDKGIVDTWGKAMESQGKGATDTWGKAIEAQDKGMVQEDPWSKGKEKCGNSSGSKTEWDTASGKQVEGWSDKGTVDTWGKAIDAQDKDTVDSWGKALETQDKGTFQENSWSKVSERGGDKDNSNGKQAEGWGNKGGSWSQQDAGKSDQGSGWGKSAADTTRPTIAGWGSGGGWGSSGASGSQNQFESWNKPKTDTSDGGSSWNKQDGESSWGKQGGSSWTPNKGGSWNKQDGGSRWNSTDRDQDGGGWIKSFDGGRGSGGRGGRGGRRGGRGRSYDGDYSQNEGNNSTGGWSSSRSGWSANQDSSADGDDNQRGSYGGDGGSWKRGGFGGRGCSDGGGYRGRGERGRIGGRNSWDRSDRGGGRFGGRGGRGGFNGRGNGSRAYDGGDGSDHGKSFDWRSGGVEEGSWKSEGGNNNGQWSSWGSGNSGNSGWSSSQNKSDNAGVWGKGAGENAEDQGGKWKSSDSSSKGQWSSWDTSSKGAEGSSSLDGGGWGRQGSGWNQNAGSGDGSRDVGGWGSQGSGSNQSAGSGDGSRDVGGWGSQGSSWNKDAGSGDQEKAWNQPGTASKGNESNQGDTGGAGYLGKSWNQSGAASGGNTGSRPKRSVSFWDDKGDNSSQGDGWGKSEVSKEGNSSGWGTAKEGSSSGAQGPTDSWTKASGSSWGNDDKGSGSGGW